MANKYLDYTGLGLLWAKIKSWFAKKENGVYWVEGSSAYARWEANHAYAVNDNITTTGGESWTCKTAHTSGSSFSSTNWNRISAVNLVGTIDGVTALYTGLKIAYHFNDLGGEGSTTLNINNLGAKTITRSTSAFYRWTLGRLGAAFLVYDGTAWRMGDYDSNDQYSIAEAFCSTAADAADKSASSLGFSHSNNRFDNLAFRIYFTNTNTAASKLRLQLNSQGYKDLWINGAVTSSTNYTLTVGVYWCYFDGTQYQLWTDKSFWAPKFRGDGSNLTETFTTASSRANIATGESNATIFGKIAKWFGDLKALAFKDKVSDSDINGAITDTHIGSAATWNAKQDALAIQTAYTSKGSATKVPQITTNTLGQVTGITEVTISGVTPASHAHGNIQNNGTLQTNDVTIADGDKLVVTDASDSNKVARASVAFDGTTTNQMLSKKGEWSDTIAKARAVVDYGATSKAIEIGWSGAAVTSPAYFAVYTNSANGYNKAIKDCSLANVKKAINGTSVGSTTVPVFINANGAPQVCTDDFVHDGDVTSTYSSTGTAPVNGTAVASAISEKADTAKVVAIADAYTQRSSATEWFKMAECTYKNVSGSFTWNGTWLATLNGTNSDNVSFGGISFFIRFAARFNTTANAPTTLSFTGMPLNSSMRKYLDTVKFKMTFDISNESAVLKLYYSPQATYRMLALKEIMGAIGNPRRDKSYWSYTSYSNSDAGVTTEPVGAAANLNMTWEYSVPSSITLTSSDDLNNIVGVGVGTIAGYQWHSGSTPSNRPFSSESYAANMLVYQTETNYTIQVVYRASKGIYQRRQMNGTWDSEWSKILTSADIAASSNNGKISVNGSDITVYTHPAGSAASKTGVPTGNVSPGFGGTFKVNQITTDSTSHVSAVTERTITIPNATATTSAVGLMSADDYKRLNGSRDIGEHDADLCTADGFYYGSSNMPATTLGWTERSGGGTDGAIFVQAHSSSWVGQIAQDYGTGNLFTRGRNNGTFTSWKRIPYLTVKNKGGTTTPVYVDANGEIQSCTAYANATVGTATNSTNSAVTADTTHQLYLIGATGSSGQQALKTDTGIYATTTAGQLHATTFDINSKCTLQFNTTTNALDFVFA